MYTKEAYFYGHLRSLLCTHVNVPEYFGQFQKEGKIGILLGDLRGLNGSFGLNLNKNVEELLKLVKAAHMLHSTYYFTCEDDVIFPMENLHKVNQISFYSQLVEQRFDKFVSRNKIFLQANELSMLTTIKEKYGKILDSQSAFPLSFCHGDLKSPNCFFVKGAQPFLLDWQYIHLNKGVSDIAFLLVESVEYDPRVVNLVESYYFLLWKEVHKELTHEQYMFDFKSALCIFPFFVMVWFNSEDSDKLLDKTFPIRFLKKLMKYYNHYIDQDFLDAL